MAQVGIIGLGIMGSAYANNLIAAGIDVIGSDPDPKAQERLTDLGGTAQATTGPWAADCDIVILALLSPVILQEVCKELGGFLNAGQVVLETGTFALEDKQAAHDILAAKGIHLLDCPVSGTGVQAQKRDILMMASGDSAAITKARPFMAHFTKGVIEAGEFGMGSRLKYVANHAVALHNAAAAETLAYADALGLDRDTTYAMLSTGAGQSKMSDLRMPLMMTGKYDPPTASLKMFEKDLSVIGDDLRRLGLKVPLFDAVDTLYKTASETLPERYDTASVFEIYRQNKQ
ncbi:NAD(P)-dependent oxidoreductase [Tateyamaria sp.]|uniref:NAD(P)-dependent oxidoreductase n=1 Tax=Tateyamaria sp. TaxID=1929288 RepID=UPI003B20D368